jgi:hypothetical protein
MNDNLNFEKGRQTILFENGKSFQMENKLGLSCAKLR